MLRAFKYRLYPTQEQEVLLSKTFGCCRYVYNWSLSTKIEAYKTDKTSISSIALINRMKSELKAEYEWLNEVNSQSLQSSIRNLDTAYTNFFRNTTPVGFPRFKSKHSNQSFACPQNVKVDISKELLTIPKIKNIPIRLHRKFKGTIKTTTISRTASGKYFASILVDTSISPVSPEAATKFATIGIDLGISTLAVCSDGRTFESNKNLKQSLNRIQVLQKRLSKKQKGSANRIKAQLNVAKLHEKIANQRKDTLHKITYSLTHDSQVGSICIEDLNVKGMIRNHHLAQAIVDASFGMFRTMLEYKCKWYGINLIKIDRFAPSSKTCNECGYINKELKLSQRSWLCPECRTYLDRDLNAAKNIKDIGYVALSSERGEVKAVEYPTMDDRSKNLRNSGTKKQQKRELNKFEAHAFRRG